MSIDILVFITGFIILTALIFIEYYRRIEIVPAFILLFIFIGIIMNIPSLVVFAGLLLPFYRIALLLLDKNYRVTSGLLYMFGQVIRPVMYVLVGASLGTYYMGKSLLLMDEWSSSVITLITVFLALVVTVNPTIESLIVPGRLSYLRIHHVIGFLTMITIISIPIIFIWSISVMGLYGLIAASTFPVQYYLFKLYRGSSLRNLIYIIYPATLLVLMYLFG